MTSRVRNRGSHESDDPWRGSESSSSDDGSEVREATQSDDEEKNEGFDMHMDSSLRQRGHRRGLMTNRLGEGMVNNGQIDADKDKEKRRRIGMKAFTNTLNTLEELSARIPQRFCTLLLITSMIIWLWVDTIERSAARKIVQTFQPQAPQQLVVPFQSQAPLVAPLQSAPQIVSNPKLELEKIRKRRQEEAMKALGSAAATNPNEGEWKLPPPDQQHGQARVDVEALPPECVPSDWQTLSFLNCNEIHEIDLRENLGPSLRQANGTTPYSDVGYVGSGLWRAVWKIHPHGPMMQANGTFDNPMVLKTMKTSHKVTGRNLDRHRRDALTMERLTSSPNIISIFGFCGNTVLTEFFNKGLDRVIYLEDEDYQSNQLPAANRETPLGRLRLALEVSKGVAALHTIPGGPIIHADLQPKQFLVGQDGTVKLNDFNRCRFMAHNNETNQTCPLRIPQAPGGCRAPEEYNMRELNEQLDVFSLGHVLFIILTGRRPFIELGQGGVQAAVKEGKQPFLDPKFKQEGSSDADLAKLVFSAYEYDPKKRITATKLVAELENLVHKYERSKL